MDAWEDFAGTASLPALVIVEIPCQLGVGYLDLVDMPSWIWRIGDVVVAYV